MNSSHRVPSGSPVRRASRSLALALLAGASIVALSACGDKKNPASQVAAKVNKEEISIHQINFVLQRQQGLKPEQTDAASRQILERLIDQELALQKASELKLDRDPRVVQQVEAARRDIIARAYVDKTGEAAAKPTAEEIKKYYDEKPALFKDRRVYSLQEIAIEAKPEQIPALRSELESAKTINDFVQSLKDKGIRYVGSAAVRSAEQLPLSMLDTFARLKDGQAILLPSQTGAQVIVLSGSRAEPVDEARARPAIEQFLLNESKRKLVEAEVKSLRAAAKIEYVGKFAESSASAPGATAPAAPAAVTQTEPVAPVTEPAASGLDATSINKGLGIK